MNDELFISTASESADRVSILPTKPSEDATGLLNQLEFPIPSSSPPEEESLPSLPSEWVVDITWNSQPLSAHALSDKFRSDAWENLGHPWMYGKDAATAKWTFLISADGPEHVTALKIAWEYCNRFDPDIPSDCASFEERLEKTREIASELPNALVHSQVEPLAAAKRAAALAKLREAHDNYFGLGLQAPPGRTFEGKQIWDVMLCLGLDWGDMDCFHWINQCAFGHDHHFSVSTSTDPGYFLPEYVAAGKVQVTDLIFTFSIPRSAHPETVFHGMWAAAEYARTRLGGQIVTLDGHLADFQTLLDYVRHEAEELRSLGFTPGTSESLRFF